MEEPPNSYGRLRGLYLRYQGKPALPPFLPPSLPPSFFLHSLAVISALIRHTYFYTLTSLTSSSPPSLSPLQVRHAQHAGASGVLVADNLCVCKDLVCHPDPGITCQGIEPVRRQGGRKGGREGGRVGGKGGEAHSVRVQGPLPAFLYSTTSPSLPPSLLSSNPSDHGGRRQRGGHHHPLLPPLQARRRRHQGEAPTGVPRAGRREGGREGENGRRMHVSDGSWLPRYFSFLHAHPSLSPSLSPLSRWK